MNKKKRDIERELELIDEADELCPHCGVEKVEIDDMGYYGCKKCFPGMTKRIKEKMLDQDGTGQDWEVYS